MFNFIHGYKAILHFSDN